MIGGNFCQKNPKSVHIVSSPILHIECYDFIPKNAAIIDKICEITSTSFSNHRIGEEYKDFPPSGWLCPVCNGQYLWQVFLEYNFIVLFEEKDGWSRVRSFRSFRILFWVGEPVYLHLSGYILCLTIFWFIPYIWEISIKINVIWYQNWWYWL